MLRRQARLRREYLYRKGVEERERAIQDKKDRVKRAVEDNVLIDGDLRRDAIDLAKRAKWDDMGPQKAEADAASGADGGAATINSQDDEYRWAGVEDPKIMITTSHNPSARLKKFAKELRLLFPNAQRLNRGNYEYKQLIDACRANDVTDFMVVHETRGRPDGLIICHLPYGPTAYFNLSDVVMRHDINKEEVSLKNVSEQYPHLIFHNFKTRLGQRAADILRYLYPVPKEDSRRVMTFANHDDYISFRHHTFKKRGDSKETELDEVGPRFQMRLYEIKLGTIEAEAAAETEWAMRPFMNTAKKRRFLSEEDGFEAY